MDQEQITIVCWKWEPIGGVPTTKKHARFHSGHVNALLEMLKKHLHRPFRLLCATDDPEGIDPEVQIVPLWDEFRFMGGCFVRLHCFRKDFDLFGGRFTSIDLDTIITGDITPLFDRTEDFIIWQPDNDGNRIAAYCGSLWTLTAGSHPEVYDSFDPSIIRPNRNNKYLGGSDQLHISKQLPNAAIYTTEDGIHNFVPDIQAAGKGLPEDARIVFFNGRYMPDDRFIAIEAPWIMEHYPLAAQGDSVFNPVKERRRLQLRTNKIKQARKYQINKLTRSMKKEDERITKIVLFWWGGWPDDKQIELGRWYVARMVDQIRKYTPLHIPYQLVLFTDAPKEVAGISVEVRKFGVPKDLRWNLKKMWMFAEDSELTGPVLCFDLDCVLLKSIEPLIKRVAEISRPNLMITCQAAYHKNNIGGSIVGFNVNPKLTELLWQRLMTDREYIERTTKGSERKFYQMQLRNQQVAFWEKAVPDAVLSYKRDCIDTIPPESAIAVRFHGNPRPHEVEADWLNEWKGNQ